MADTFEYRKFEQQLTARLDPRLSSKLSVLPEGRRLRVRALGSHHRGKPPSRWLLSLFSSYNVVGTLAAGLALWRLRNPIILDAWMAAEVAWVFVTTQPWVSDRLFADRIAEHADQQALRHFKDLLDLMRPEDRDRTLGLWKLVTEIFIQVAEAGHAEHGALEDALDKVDQAYAAFYELAAIRSGWEGYLAAERKDEVLKEATELTDALTTTTDAAQRELTEKSLAVLKERLGQLSDLDKKLTAARTQLDLLENGIKLVCDQLLLKQDPAELGGSVDALLAEAEAVREIMGDASPAAVPKVPQAQATRS